MFSILPNIKNYQSITRKKDTIKYIVVHYTGNNGDTARGNLNYFKNNVVYASAHFFVDEKEVCTSVPVSHAAYHAGKKDMNNISIGVEMCSRKNQTGYYFKPETERNAAKHIAGLMKEYKIPIDRVIRHYDVTGKLCPAPYVEEKEWQRFKSLILEYLNPKKKEEENPMVYYETLDQIPAGELREVIAKLVDRGTIKGNGGGLHLSEDMVRMFVFMNREGILK